MMYGKEKPGYVSWFLSGNVNADANPGGPLIFDDTLGADQMLDGTGIGIDLYWNGQQHPTYHLHFNSIEDFLNSPYGSGVGSEIKYDKATGKIYIKIPDQVLRGVQFIFSYDALITNPDALRFYNKANMSFYENGKPDQRQDNSVVENIDVGGYIYGKTRAFLNINKVAGEKKIPVPGVTFEIKREDGGQLYLNRNETLIQLTTDEQGQIRESGFRPGILVVREVSAPNYVAFNPQEQQKIELIVNNKDQIHAIENQLKTISIPVTKQWVGKSGKSVTVNLLADGVKVNSATLTQETNWKHTFKDLAKYDTKDGREIKYTIEEVAIDGYTTSISGDATTGFTITNTIAGKVSVPVTKKWVGKVGQSATIHLLADGKKVDTATLTEKTNWQHTFTNLEQYKDGKAIAYTISEEPIKGYDTTITGNVTEGFTVENTNVEKTAIPVEKKWVGEATESVTVKLFADGVEKETATLTAQTNWKHTFKDLAKYDTKDGHEIKYTIEEVAIDGYTTGISGDATTGFTITNTIAGKVSVPVTKKWVGKVGQSATIHLLADGKKVDTATLTEKTNWQHTFTNLEQYKDGKAISYTISEEPIKGYDTTITGNVTEGFTVENTNVEKTAIPVEKKWVGEATESVTVKLFADGVEKETATLTAQTNWKHTFKDLAKYDTKDGREIKYTIEEVAIDGYTTGISGDATTGFTITNTIAGKVSVPVTKKWVGKVGQSATIHLLADGKKVDTATLTEKTNWQHTFTNLEQYKDGKAIAYTISEEPIKGYDTTITGNATKGFTVVNTEIKKKSALPATGDSQTGSLGSVVLSLLGSILLIGMTIIYRKKLS